MIQNNTLTKNRRKERIDINNLNDFKDALKKEGYNVSEFNEEVLKEKIIQTFNVSKDVADRLHICVKDTKVTYRTSNVKGLIDYVEKIMLFENEHKKLCSKIRKVKKLSIDRIEYDRELSSQDNVEHIIKEVEEIKTKVSRQISKEEISKLEILELELDKSYIYAKDIELLKKMVLIKNEDIRERYNQNTRIKTISIKIPAQINNQYIKAKEGTVEYHQHLNSNIPRIKRLVKNINRYMEVDGNEKTTFKIDQSKALQDSINIAVATYDNKEFKAISGSNDITGYCTAPPLEDAIFKSSKVNKLGKLGVGYNRVNDSEKKILEEIHRQIEAKILANEGTLVLYSKWEPCPSCYFVISQFCKKYPNIKVQVKYNKKYGEIS